MLLDFRSYENKALFYVSNLDTLNARTLFVSSGLPERNLSLFSMIRLGLFIGFYALALTALGFASSLKTGSILLITLVFFAAFVYSIRNDLKRLRNLRPKKSSKHEKILLALLASAAIVNFWGILVPETAFDALWYHLTIPKLYLEANEVYPIAGGLLYYSGFPKLIEVLYLLPLSLSYETGTKLIHFMFGILSLITVTILAKKYVSEKYLLLVPSILAANLVFAWESTTAFNDLSVMFYEILAFYSFTKFFNTRKDSWLLMLGLMLGFSLLTKLTVLISLLVYVLLILFIRKKETVGKVFRSILIVLFFSFLPSLPWFVFNRIYFGNAIYPMGTEYLAASERLFPVNLANILGNILFPSDPISPIYLIFLPFAYFVWKKLNFPQKLVFYYISLSFVLWLFVSSTGGSRFLLPFLPVYSVGVVIVIDKASGLLGKGFYKLSFVLIALLLLSSTIYRFAAQFDSLSYLVGRESKQEYLYRKLNFSFGDFYDTDRYFDQNIGSESLVLIYDFHNLYYANFPFIHETWYRGEDIDFVLTQSTQLPVNFKLWDRVYSNPTTGAVLYKNPN